jgi:hypothetical protein
VVPRVNEEVNGWLARLRILSRAAALAPLSPVEATWRLMFRADDGSELEPDPSYIRAIAGGSSSVTSVALSQELWESVGELQWGFVPRSDDLLLLDAHNSVNEVGPALVYGMPRHLWLWINDRKDYTKAPSTVEQFDTLLSALTGRSLKEDSRLWEGFQNLRRARNSFVHDGQSLVGRDVVDAPRAANLVAIAEEILDWVDGLLPENERRPKFDTSSIRAQQIKLIVGSNQKEAPDGGTDAQL